MAARIVELIRHEGSLELENVSSKDQIEEKIEDFVSFVRNHILGKYYLFDH